MAYTPPVIKLKTGVNDFGGLKTDGNRVAMTGALANTMSSIDATGTPVTSPVTVNTTATLVVPQAAVSVLIASVTNPVQVSEDSTQTAYFTLPAGVPTVFQCANQQNVYLKTSGSTAVSFQFQVV